MELWVRSQNKEQLANITGLIFVDNEIRGFTNQKDYYELGRYETKERALEVLDEIQSKIKSLLYLKPRSKLSLNDIKIGKQIFEELNNTDFITCDNNFEIQPITTNVIVYEMPEN